MPADDYGNLISSPPPKKKKLAIKIPKPKNKKEKEKPSISRRLFLTKTATKRIKKGSNSDSTFGRKVGVSAVVEDVMEDINSLKNFFDISEKSHVHRLLNLLKNNKDVITWDRSNYEIIIKSVRYPGSNLLDILTYLFKRGTSEPFFVTANYEVNNKEQGIPQNTKDFVAALLDLVPIKEADKKKKMKKLFKMFRFVETKVDKIMELNQEHVDIGVRKMDKEREQLEEKREKHRVNERNLARSLEIMQAEELRKLQEEIDRKKNLPKSIIHSPQQVLKERETKVKQMSENFMKYDGDEIYKNERKKLLRRYHNNDVNYPTLKRNLSNLQNEHRTRAEAERIKREAEEAEELERSLILQEDLPLLSAEDDEVVDDEITFKKTPKKLKRKKAVLKTVAEQTADASHDDDLSIEEQMRLRNTADETPPDTTHFPPERFYRNKDRKKSSRHRSLST